MSDYKTVNFEVRFKVLERVIERRFKIHKNNPKERRFEGVCVCGLREHNKISVKFCVYII